MKTKNILRMALGTALILLIPLLGKWPWTLSDFIVAGTFIFSIGFILDLVMRKAGKYRIPAAIAIVILFLWLWVELAVGLFTNWGS